MSRAHVATIVRTELRRRSRLIRRDDQKLGYAVVGALVVAVVVIALARTAYAAGQSAGSGADALAVASLSFAVVPVAGIALVGLRVIQDVAGPTAPKAVLPAARHRDVVYAHVLVESLFLFSFTGLPFLFGGAAFVIGAGSLLGVVPVTAAVVAVVLLGASAGFAAGYAIRSAIARSSLLARYRAAAAFLGVLGYFAVLLLADVSALVSTIVGTVGATPLGWFGDLALLGVVPAADPTRAGLVVLWTALALVALTTVSSRLTASLWYTSPVVARTPTGSTTLPRVPFVSEPTDAVVRKVWKRARRSPIRLFYVGYGALLVVMLLADALRDGSVPPIMAPLVALYAAWATGAAVTLNPFGEEGPALPVTLTTPVGGRRLVAGFWIAVALVGAPASALATLVVAVAAGLGPLDAALFGVGGGVTAALAPGLASGIGTALPRTERIEVFRRQTSLVPSAPAFYLYTLALGVVTLPVWAAMPGLSRSLAAGVVLPPVGVRVAAVAAAALSLGAAGTISYRLAGRRIDAYGFD